MIIVGYSFGQEPQEIEMFLDSDRTCRQQEKRAGRNQDHNHPELSNDSCTHSRMVGSAALLKRNSE
jgi:hypothetical protein